MKRLSIFPLIAIMTIGCTGHRVSQSVHWQEIATEMAETTEVTEVAEVAEINGEVAEVTEVKEIKEYAEVVATTEVVTTTEATEVIEATEVVEEEQVAQIEESNEQSTMITGTSETIKLGDEITKVNGNKRKRRRLTQYLIIPKGEWQVGAQISHASISSNNSEYALLINGLDANGSITKIAPFVSYAFKNNQAVGLRFQYTTADAAIDAAELDLLSDDLEFELENLHSRLYSIQTSLYYRTYIGLDNRGRIGLFNDIALSYNYSRSRFRYNEQTENSYARSNQIKLSLHPGIAVFVMNNVSANVSVGIGGVSYNNIKYFRDGAFVGKRDFSKASFKLDILDISFGLSLHL